MAIAVTASTSSRGSTANATICKPATVNDNDILVAILGGMATVSGTYAIPSGWKVYQLTTATGNDVYTGLFYRTVPSAAALTGTYTFIGTAAQTWAAYVQALSGVNQATPEDVSFASKWQNLQNATIGTTPSYTTINSGVFGYAAYAINLDAATTQSPGRFGTNNADDLNGILNVMSGLFVSPVATGTTAITAISASQESQAGIFLFRPSAVAVTPARARISVIVQNPILTKHATALPSTAKISIAIKAPRTHVSLSNSVEFDGVDDSISGSVVDTFLTENGAVSVSWWMNPYITHDGRIIARHITGGSVGVGIRTTITTNRLRFTISGATLLVRQTVDNSVTLGSWNHYVLTHDGSVTAANCHIYKNGTELTYITTTNGLTPTDNSLALWRIGIDGDSAGSPFNGGITELAVWDSVITAGNISTLYNSGIFTKNLPLTITTPKLYLPMDDGAVATLIEGDTVFDFSGNENNGTGADGTNNTGGLWSFRKPAPENVIVTPSTAKTTIQVNTAVASTSSGSSPTIATPAVQLVSVVVQAPTPKISKSAIATPTINSISVIVQASTARTFSNATSLPVISRITLLANAVLTKISKSSIAIPSLVSIKISVGTAVASTAIKTIATAVLKTISVLVNNPAVKFTKSSVATPSISSISVVAKVAVASTSVSRSSIATPLKAVVSITVFTAIGGARTGINVTTTISRITITTPSPLVKVIKNAIASSNLASITLIANAPTTKTSRNATAISTKINISILVNQATTKITRNALASPALSSIRIISNVPITVISKSQAVNATTSVITLKIYQASASVGQTIPGVPIIVSIVLSSKIEPIMNHNSRIDPYLNQGSRIDTVLNSKSKIEPCLNDESKIDNTPILLKSLLED